MTLTSGGRVHFVGIGGAGMSAIAKILIERGLTVSGSDLKTSRAATMLEAMGAQVHIGHDASLVDGASHVVVSSAIPEGNPERLRAAELGIETLSRGAALAALLEGMRSVVVSGTHGKTTTTSMLATVLRVAGCDPTYLIGAGLNDAGTNARSGRSDVVVAESDESDGSFLLLRPFIGVVTNIELDHVDHWGSFEELRAAFTRFLAATPSEGCVVVPLAEKDLLSPGARALFTGPGGDLWAEDVETVALGSSFTLTTATERHAVGLQVPGEHNVANALSAAAACLALDVPMEDVAAGLSRFRGVERRFERRGEVEGITVVDDYAHHPTEVSATLAAARTGPWARVIAVFQPHRYSRTAALAEGFGRSFDDADAVVIMDVYGAGEDPVPGVSGRSIADAAAAHLGDRPVVYLPHRDELLAHLRAMSRSGDVIVMMGAGDISAVGDELLALLGGRS